MELFFQTSLTFPVVLFSFMLCVAMLYWLTVALVIPLTLICAPLGVNVAHAMSKRQMEVAFGIFMLIIAARFFVSLL